MRTVQCKIVAVLLMALVPFGPMPAWSQGRTQNFVVSQSEAHSKGAEFFEQVKAKAREKGSLVESGETYDRVKAITDSLIKSAVEHRSDVDSWAWEFILIQSSNVNAACLPGGKIIVYTGIIDTLALNDDELAAVIGHEIAHALKEHGREKTSNAQIAKVAVGILAIVAGVYGYRHRVDPSVAMDAATLLGGAGAAMFFLLPNSREMELEADYIGIEIAARSGHDPAAAVTLWQKMAARGDGGIEFLSTHPAPETRVNEIAAAAVPVSQKFAERRSARLLAVATSGSGGMMGPPAPKPVLSDSVACAMPSGAVEAFAPMVCTRMGGTITERQQ